ncbi:transcriptional regulator [Pseudomonas sp. s4]|uniref:transcriptional regulator n=1 Tax=Pseudomonas sp. s4 TaxID=353218 RepID=UPI00398D1008
MKVRPAFAMLVLLSFPLMAAESSSPPSGKEVMKQHQAQIQNRLADVDYNRKRVVELNMALESEEAERFWPIYNTYRAEAAKISRQTLEIMIDYSGAYSTGNVTDELASSLLQRVNDLQQRQLDLRQKYIQRIAKDVSPKRAMRFLQIETQLDSINNLDIGRELPLVE